MTITTYGTICRVGGSLYAFFLKAVGPDFYVSPDIAGQLSRAGMAFQPCRNEELFQPALAADISATSMIAQGCKRQERLDGSFQQKNLQFVWKHL